MRKARFGPGDCVVCGLPVRSGHKCPKSVLAGLDAAERHANNVDDPANPAIPGCMDDRLRPFGQRLAEGFGEAC